MLREPGHPVTTRATGWYALSAPGIVPTPSRTCQTSRAGCLVGTLRRWHFGLCPVPLGAFVTESAPKACRGGHSQCHGRTPKPPGPALARSCREVACGTSTTASADRDVCYGPSRRCAMLPDLPDMHGARLRPRQRSLHAGSIARIKRARCVRQPQTTPDPGPGA